MQKYSILSTTHMLDSTAAVFKQLEGKDLHGKLPEKRFYNRAFIATHSTKGKPICNPTRVGDCKPFSYDGGCHIDLFSKTT
jgi:hypothetical protein